MTLPDLLTDLAGAGVLLTLTDGSIEANAPAGALTGDLLAGLKTHKADLLEILAEPAEPCPGNESAVMIRLVTGPTGHCKEWYLTAAERLAWRDIDAAVEPCPGTLPKVCDDGIAFLADPHCPRCGAEGYRDTQIHAGESIRRDCLVCGRTYGFPTWHGRKTACEDGPK